MLTARLRTACLIPSLALLLIPGGASGQGVVEPDSPAGQEYELPFEKARQQGAGEEDYNAAPGDEPSAVPFGEGVSPPAPGEAADAELGLEREIAAAGEPIPNLTEDPASGNLTSLAIVFGALLLAGTVAFAMRSRR